MAAPPLPPIHRPRWRDSEHHAETGFRNPWRGPEDDVDGFRAAGWMLSFPFRHDQGSAETPFCLLSPAALTASGEPRLRVAWLGHASALLQMGGLNVLTDPVFSERASPLAIAGPKRLIPLPLAAADLPHIDVIVLSHDHYDHLDLEALAFFHARDAPLIAAPLALARHFGRDLRNARVLELDWSEYFEYEGLRFHCTPAKHFSGRGLLDRDQGLWCSWLIEPETASDTPTVYFAADTGYSPHFAEIVEHLGAPDVVLMPIGAYEPRWLMERVHVDPAGAVQAFLDLGAAASGAHLIPIHWGTFRLTDEPLQEPPKRLMEEAAGRGIDASRVHVLPVGGVWEM